MKNLLPVLATVDADSGNGTLQNFESVLKQLGENNKPGIGLEETKQALRFFLLPVASNASRKGVNYRSNISYKTNEFVVNGYSSKQAINSEKILCECK